MRKRTSVNVYRNCVKTVDCCLPVSTNKEKPVRVEIDQESVT